MGFTKKNSYILLFSKKGSIKVFLYLMNWVKIVQRSSGFVPKGLYWIPFNFIGEESTYEEGKNLKNIVYLTHVGGKCIFDRDEKSF